MAEPAGVCWINGAIVPLHEARIPVTDHGLLYGDGVFEGIRYYNGTPFRLDAHLQRLADSARAIALSLPKPLPRIAAIVRDVIAASGSADGYLRLVVTRGPGPLGIDPAPCRQPGLFVIAAPLALVPEDRREQGISVIIAATRRLPTDGLDPRIKSLNYLNHILARIEANRAGADEALLLNHRGHVAEGSADNLFVVKGDCLLTPPVIDGALDGITRSWVLTAAHELGIPTAERSLSAFDLYTANECFLTGTGAELIPVQNIDGRELPNCPGPVFQRLAAAFREAVGGTS